MFLGRFHPLVVHLPIGFLILAIIFGFMSSREKYLNLKPAFNLSLLLGAISSVIAVILGFFLASSGGYNADTLGWHKWMGIILMVLSLLGFAANNWKILRPVHVERLNVYLLPVLLGVIIFTGHLGGNLTHGSTYLTEYAPGFVKKLAGANSQGIDPQPITNLDSAVVFRDLVFPVFSAKCKSCHNQDKMKGELNLMAFATAVDGGESGNTIVPGDPESSELIKRILLPEDHDDVMPPKDKTPLTENEIALLTWWIETGASEHEKVASLQTNPEMKVVLSSVAGLTKEDKGMLVENDPGPLDEQVIAKLKELGFLVKPVAQGNNWYEADFSLAKQEFSDQHMSALQEASNHITWLFLNDSNLNDEDLNGLESLTSLTKLRLDNNPITDQSIGRLSEMSELVYLNLYGTEVTDDCLTQLAALPELKKLYLWQTNVNPEILAAMDDTGWDVEFGSSLNLQETVEN